MLQETPHFGRVQSFASFLVEFMQLKILWTSLELQEKIYWPMILHDILHRMQDIFRCTAALFCLQFSAFISVFGRRQKIVQLSTKHVCGLWSYQTVPSEKPKMLGRLLLWPFICSLRDYAYQILSLSNKDLTEIEKVYITNSSFEPSSSHHVANIC
ncbi:uncharacterized protein LOC110668086 isoform X2 [Hevea brasiliensis]|uniref:uncharacterized protein LOC110668086 isoform X2 n=1 Tax=Hevea brasiliensis TaxID=3981 RepID=UPI0025CCEA04|nr:uncharacterized protein LOC110668086 isoform X2 [Hevea brasiliensis]